MVPSLQPTPWRLAVAFPPQGSVDFLIPHHSEARQASRSNHRSQPRLALRTKNGTPLSRHDVRFFIPRGNRLEKEELMFQGEASTSRCSVFWLAGLISLLIRSSATKTHPRYTQRRILEARYGSICALAFPTRAVVPDDPADSTSPTRPDV